MFVGQREGVEFVSDLESDFTKYEALNVAR